MVPFVARPSAGGATGRLNGPSICTSVACCTVSGTAGISRWLRLERVARAAHAVFRLDLPQQGLSCA
jgi:hypothetical protein